MLRSEGLIGPKRAEEARSAVLTSGGPKGRSVLSRAEEAAQPVGQVWGFVRSAFVVSEIVRMYWDARLAEEGDGVFQTRFGGSVGECGLDQVVAVPANAVDTKACELVLCKAPVEV